MKARSFLLQPLGSFTWSTLMCSHGTQIVKMSTGLGLQTLKWSGNWKTVLVILNGFQAIIAIT